MAELGMPYTGVFVRAVGLLVTVVLAVVFFAWGTEADTDLSTTDTEAAEVDETEADTQRSPVVADEADDDEEAVEATDEPTAEESTGDQDAPSMELMLAAIDTNDSNPPDSTVAAYGMALDAAEAKCQQDRDLVGDMAVRATQLAEENGLQASVMDMLQGVSLVVPDELAPVDCAEVLSAILVLMENG